jgi:hypothetical protein
MLVAARIQGIPCTVEVTHYYVTRDDWDPIEFRVLDQSRPCRPVAGAEDDGRRCHSR